MEPAALVSSYSLKPGLRVPSFAPLSPRPSRPSNRHRRLLFFPLPVSWPGSGGRGRSFVTLLPKAAAEVPDGRPSRSVAGGRGGRGVLRQSQAQSTAPSFPVKEVASLVVPAGVFIATTFGMRFASPISRHCSERGLWSIEYLDIRVFIELENFIKGQHGLAVLWKVVGKVLMPKPKGSTSGVNKSLFPGIKWSFSPGTNLQSGSSLKIERESRQKLNEFAKELRTFSSVDMSGDYNDLLERHLDCTYHAVFSQAAEEVDFSGNGITAAGLKAFDGVLQINTVLKTLNLSGNNIGDEGARVILFLNFTIFSKYLFV
ncbi:hypothetical protein B296_00046154 [Ensete ventricosum]|uniref:Uncharacterized protein n=1 Tax=Ensete ventricosum TaxID=4639 RepID=A0A426Z1H9_ENSVE|nr:hypothetical protein B296_00046154 [Ensete ventricosum]